MNIHGIEYDSMLNGDGMRCVLWVAGCEHHCKGCHNPQTHDLNSGYEMMADDLLHIIDYLEKDYVSGITLSGGDPLHPQNRKSICFIARTLKERMPRKTIWLYTGYQFEEIKNLPVMKYVDVVIDGEFVQELMEQNLHWRGSSNQCIWRKINGIWEKYDD